MEKSLLDFYRFVSDYQIPIDNADDKYNLDGNNLKLTLNGNLGELTINYYENSHLFNAILNLNRDGLINLLLTRFNDLTKLEVIKQPDFYLKDTCWEIGINPLLSQPYQNLSHCNFQS